MDWKDLAGTLARAGAPIIGTALGGPFGGMIGGAIGNILGNALGTDPTPEAVGAAVTTGDPATIRSQLSGADTEAVAKWPALAQIAQAEASDRTAQSQAINATMQAEVAKGLPWWAWRNLWGYSVTIECSAVAVILLIQLATGDAKALNLFAQFTGFILSWFGMRVGVLGYIYRGASNEKIAAVTGENPGMVTQIIKAVSKR